MPTITLYGKPGCHLCDVALDDLEAVRKTHPFEIVKVNIEDDPELVSRYGDLIPVMLLDGAPLFKYRVNAARLRQRLEVK